MSDWSQDELQALYGVKDPYYDSSRVIDFDAVDIELLVNGTISLEDAFVQSNADVEGGRRRRKLQSTDAVTLPAYLDYRYADANPKGVMAMTPIKVRISCSDERGWKGLLIKANLLVLSLSPPI